MSGSSTSWNPLVSVIINCYNGETYLHEAIDSVFSQTYKNWEIIFWDNASTDGSAAIAKGYGEKVKYFHGNKNIPLGAARNQAMKQVHGELVGFLDCDDIWLSTKLEKQVQAMAPGYALCYGGVILIDRYGNMIGKEIPKQKHGQIFKKLLLQFDINLPTAMIRKAALDASMLSFDCNIRASEEYCLFMQFSINYDYICMEETLAKYRIHDEALTNKSIGVWADERDYTLHRIVEQYPNIRNQYPHEFREAFARGRYYKARYLVFKGEKKAARKEMYHIIGVDVRYLILWFLLWLPSRIWNFFHEYKSFRKKYI